MRLYAIQGIAASALPLVSRSPRTPRFLLLREFQTLGRGVPFGWVSSGLKAGAERSYY